MKFQICIIVFSFLFHGSVNYGNGHYTSHVRRSFNSPFWETHNDLVKKIKTCKNPKNVVVKPHVIVYTKK